ncbi:Panacea domain-containing protein [Clostridium pasteurianum]|uniref:Putative phage-associated protein n=1 Tax=Clostridium pasteurianum BC1 TaxID=86416 RepID=R4JWI6_CLOPA|nr:type II toxin-antitoxin system antitoxin SocA domain-containing protein [Clostridium pasteurianum]AGK95192.1 putative phage-associated protein [Clostridium pasteurianum BC1]
MYKAKEIARWFLIRNYAEEQQDSEIEEMTNLKIQKLLYYAQGVHLAIEDYPLFSDNIVAWKHGPVVVDVYYEYKENGGNGIKYIPEPYDEGIYKKLVEDKENIDMLEFVYKEFGQYTAWKLRNMTHNEKPWKETEQGQIINNELIKEFFRNEIVEV